MWPFLKKKGQERAGGYPVGMDCRPRPVGLAKLLEGIGDFSDLQRHDKAIKFWLPEPAYEALKEFCARNGDSMSKALREFFAAHCYGIYACQLVVDAHPDMFEEASRVKFSRLRQPQATYMKRNPTYWVPELGKNVAPLKVWIPARMVGDLKTLADHVGVKLSQYAREIVISRLFGHGTLPMRPEMLKAEPLPAADEWCEGSENMAMPMRQVSEEEYLHSRHGEVRWGDEDAAEENSACSSRE